MQSFFHSGRAGKGETHAISKAAIQLTSSWFLVKQLSYKYHSKCVVEKQSIVESAMRAECPFCQREQAKTMAMECHWMT